MPCKPSIRPFGPGQATRFAPAIIFLRSGLHVSSRRVADAFGTSTTNVDTIRCRGASVVGDPGIESLLDPSAAIAAAGFSARYGFRPMLRNRPLPEQSVRLDALELDIKAAFERHARGYDYVGGAQALRELSEKAGYPRHPRFLRLIARVHGARCWFFSHAGLSVSAMREAALAVPLMYFLHRQTGDLSLLRQMHDCYIATANACMLRRRPAAGSLLLEKARQLSEFLALPNNWEWLRLQGNVRFLLNDLEEATRNYRRTLEVTRDKEDGFNGFPGQRHLALIQPTDWNEQTALLWRTGANVGKASLEYSVQLHWTVAAGLVADNAAVNEAAYQLLDDAPTTIFGSFGHQATINQLLRLTEKLSLDQRDRSNWVRFLMYENAQRDC